MAGFETGTRFILEFPDLRQRITVNIPGEVGQDGGAETHTVFGDLADCPEVKSHWKQYFEKKWSPWAEENRRLQAVQKV